MIITACFAIIDLRVLFTKSRLSAAFFSFNFESFQQTMQLFLTALIPCLN